jgi:hypothetical protein
MPVAMHRLMRWRMDRVHDDAWGGMVRIQRDQPELVREVADVVRSSGPITSTELESLFAHIDRGPREHWGWNWSAVKRSLEYLFWAGEITSAGRDPSFRRRYAAPEAVLPRSALQAPTPEPAEAHRELVAIAARAMGVATLADLADYFRMPTADTRTAVRDLVTVGELTELAVPGWPTSYAPADLRVPRRVDASALLAPFDPLVWFRPRTERLFGMRYRIEIYTPAEKRVHGYYVLPFLHDEQLVARVDLKSDRASRRLLVQAAHPEAAIHSGSVDALATSLVEAARWLGLDEVDVAPVGELAGRLRGAIRSQR